MFKNQAQRAAFFAALKKKKAGMDNTDALKVKQNPIKLEDVGKTVEAPEIKIEEVKPKIPKFGKLKNLMKMKVK